MADELPQESAVDVHDGTEKSEPALSTGGVIAGGTLLINGLIMFGITISPDQKLYLVSVITFLAPLLAGAIIRFKVWSPRSVARLASAYQVRLSAAERQADSAKAQVAAARSAVDAVQATIPAMVQSLVSVPAPATAPIAPVAAPERPREPDLPRPPSDRVYGPAGAPQAPARTTNGTAQYAEAPRPEPTQVWAPPPGVPAPAEAPGYRQYGQPPRGYRRHRRDEG